VFPCVLVGNSGAGYAEMLRSSSWFSERCVESVSRFEEMMLAWDCREGLCYGDLLAFELARTKRNIKEEVI
jgi:hypothetical protein